MNVWVRRSREGPPADVWHLFDPMTRGDVRAGACGTQFDSLDTLDRLDLANPRDADRCPACQTAYLGELRGGQFA